MGCKQEGAKNRVIVIQKEKRPGCLCFLHPAFCNPYFGPNFFQCHKPTHIFKARIVGADWLGQYIHGKVLLPHSFFISRYIMLKFWVIFGSISSLFFMGTQWQQQWLLSFFSTWAKALWCGRLQEICMKLIPLRNDIGNKYSRSWLSRNCENFKKI